MGGGQEEQKCRVYTVHVADILVNEWNATDQNRIRRLICSMQQSVQKEGIPDTEISDDALKDTFMERTPALQTF